MAWWDTISGVNQFYYCGALFFSIFFVWQLITAVAGTDMGGEGEADIGGDAGVGDLEADPTYADFEEGATGDAVESLAAFRLLSLRSLVTFFTLFFWGNALYTHNGMSFGRSFGYSTLWGLTGMFCVAIVFYLLTRLSEEGTGSLATCLGKEATVYHNIPQDGVGRVRTMVGTAVSYVKARSVSGKPIAAGCRVLVTRQVETNLLEVKPLRMTKEKGEEAEV